MRSKTFHLTTILAAVSLIGLSLASTAQAELNQPPEGFTALFNGKDLTGWKGLLKGPYDNPDKRSALEPDKLAELQKEANDNMVAHWKVVDGVLVFDGKGRSLCTAKDYADFEMLVDWKIEKAGDSGIYLRGAPQVQIWDTALRTVGAQVGSGGLYNNQKNPSKPTKVADKPVGEWNTFRIIMIGENVTVYLNGELVVDNVVMENYWDRSKPIYPTGQIELQNHGNFLYFRNIYIREILTAEERLAGFVPLFNGRDMAGWTGNTTGYYAEDGRMICDPKKAGGNVYTADEYGDFIFRFEFKLTPGANNGLGIRTGLSGDAAYSGMELQILDDTAAKYATLQPYQYHGSIYGVVPAKRGHQKPVGEWNSQEVIAKGPQITVNLNGTTIVDADIEKASTPKTMDGRDHPGLKNPKGHIGFCGHGDYLEFRNIRIKPLD
ncbi:MAG: DUF1080 domain-containing protein [Sedimentisphaerales bacterium]|nr:DUF1080 domain-containing protein [Sedimentisphaerales bacterium]HNY79257.1 DUF1080 domain-containing protein [Sedimentisphaerales bacterium]HOC61545.1 DUF1080 domain-containing protein [Sedimentisphaerales bacterium]HOH65191.1 DUF1080 domain-containing protein [Sedimentisphaerales bacterium]HPY51874.1 DUF1080 domain-containing protein [Sedimentisphaerales bacterium]